MVTRKSEKSQKIREERQSQILQAAMDLFAKKGLHNTKISEIAARAGVSQGTIYWYFDSKEALFKKAFMNQVDAINNPLFEILSDESRSPGEKLISVAESSIDAVVDNREELWVMLQAMVTQEIADLLTHDFPKYYRHFKADLEPLFDKLGDPDPSATSATFMAVLDGLMIQSLLDPDTFDVNRILAQIKEKFNL